MAANCVHRRACNARPIGNDQAADQYDQAQTDVDRQKPTHLSRWRTSPLGKPIFGSGGKSWCADCGLEDIATSLVHHRLRQPVFIGAVTGENALPLSAMGQLGRVRVQRSRGLRRGLSGGRWIVHCDSLASIQATGCDVQVRVINSRKVVQENRSSQLPCNEAISGQAIVS